MRQGDEVTARWRELGEGLIVKYLDGNVRVDGKATFPGYPADWLRRIQQDRGEHLELERKPAVAGP